jgi:predicted porin
MFNLGEFSMKKTLVAIAALAAISAFAQSTVTLSGGLGMGYQQKPNDVKDKGFGITDYTIRLSGSEDLGGGLKANFTMELSDAASSAVNKLCQINPGQANAGVVTQAPTTGLCAAGSTLINTRAFNNGQFRSTVGRDTTRMSLSGGFGEIGLRNTRSTDLITQAFVAPASLPDGIYDSAVIARAPVDGFGYSSPSFGGFRFGIDYAESSNDGNITPVNKTVTLGGSYSNGPLMIAAAHKSTSGLVAGVKKTNLELVGTYNFGFATVGLGFDGKRANTVTDKNAFALGIAAPFGPVTVGVNYAKRDTAKVVEAVAKYDLSKRTSINASFGKQSNAAKTDDPNSQYRIKVQHNF